MPKPRVLVIGLDGYEATVGEYLMAQGRLENLRAVKQQSARYLLDHGLEKYTGLGGEHFSSGQVPETSNRWTAVHFDPEHYDVSQRVTTLEPFVANLTAKSVIFDPTYFDLGKAPNARGLVAWGAHDPGVAQMSKPTDLNAEILQRFGPYRAADCIYGFTWPSMRKTIEVGDKLTRAVDQRAQIARWLLAERFRDWDLGVVVISEVHSVLEPMWHGMDPSHPLHHLPSAQPARIAVEGVYQAVDRLIGKLISSLPNTTVVTFAMHGMGPNEADVPSMLLLPELLYRKEFGYSLFTARSDWADQANDVPLLMEHEKWETVIKERLQHEPLSTASSTHTGWRYLQQLLKSLARTAPFNFKQQRTTTDLSIDWMPATQYRRYWPTMKSFALPAFYDARIRINLKGREKEGIVKKADYDAHCQEIETFVRQCQDLRTGEPVVQAVERPSGRHPLELGPTEADLIVRWRGSPLGFRHPKVGNIGPVPYRRTGGHTGNHGMAYLSGKGLLPGDYGIRSSFDVVPTLFELLGEQQPKHIAGQSLLKGIQKLR